MLLTALALSLASAQSVDARVEATLQQMTLDEKLAYIGGDRDFYIRPVPRLGLPEVKMSDGPVGVRNYGPTTAYAAGACLASTWNKDLAKRVGTQVGRDARARGVHIWLGPGVNLARTTQNGRNFEYFGEDPFLSGTTAAAEIQGVQSQGVAATVKHFAANDHEDDRNRDDSVVDERVLRELYLVPFEMAVKDGGVKCIMSGYNLLNGTHCSQNDWLINKVLKTEWGFKGIHMSDWGGAHSADGCANGGLDLEMPSGYFMNAKNLRPLLDSGQVKESTIDEKVRRIIRTIYASDWDKRPQVDTSIPKDDPTSEAAALQTAREGIVLLKNQNGFLPLNAKKTKHIIVVGPNAAVPATGGGGSAYTTPFKPLGLPEALKSIAGPGVTVETIPFDVSMDAALDITDFKAEYFNGTRPNGTPILTRTDHKIDFDWGQGSPGAGVPVDKFSVRWTKDITVPTTGVYLLVGKSDDGMRASIDGKRVLNSWYDHGLMTATGTVTLEAGRTYHLQVQYFEDAGDAVAKFGIVPVQKVIESTLPADKLRAADAVIACVGFRSDSEGEGFDRPFDLPQDQQFVLDQITANSKKVVIALNSGAGVNIAKWLAKSPAMLQCWYPGGRGNQALAEILFGKTNPSGKLATSFPRTMDGTYYANAYPSKDQKMVYNEGLFIGYRWFDANNKAPLFPFGFGLSYTTFNIRPIQANEKSVTVEVQNTGKIEGAEVVQLYVGEAKPATKQPVRELKGFAKVNLKPGASTKVTIPLNMRSYAHWDTKAHDWKVAKGTYNLWVGDSSRSLSLVGVVKK